MTLFPLLGKILVMKKKRPLSVRLKEKIKDTLKIWQVNIMALIFPAGIWFSTHSWNIKQQIDPETQALLDAGQPVIFAVWHGRMYSIIRACNPKKTNILISPSRDGDMIARALEKLGFFAIRGSHQRNGTQALREMHRAVKNEKRSLIFMVDGPRGPRYKVKPGVIKLASQTRIPIVPIYSSNKKFLAIFKKSWDRFHYPMLFTSLRVNLGKPIYVPARLRDDEQVELYRTELENVMIAETTVLDHYYGGKETIQAFPPS